MSTQSQTEHFTGALTTLLDETFDSVHGIFLDKGTSMFETLATISAEEASIPVGGRCATLAAQVTHVASYLDVLEQGGRIDDKARSWDVRGCHATAIGAGRRAWRSAGQNVA